MTCLFPFPTFQIYITDSDTGFCAVQHLRLHVSFDFKGVFEAHPFSILPAPSSGSSFSCIRYKRTDMKNKIASLIQEEGPAGIALGTRVAGYWMSSLNAYAKIRGPHPGALSFVFIFRCMASLSPIHDTYSSHVSRSFWWMQARSGNI